MVVGPWLWALGAVLGEQFYEGSGGESVANVSVLLSIPCRFGAVRAQRRGVHGGGVQGFLFCLFRYRRPINGSGGAMDTQRCFACGLARLHVVLRCRRFCWDFFYYQERIQRECFVVLFQFHRSHFLFFQDIIRCVFGVFVLDVCFFSFVRGRFRCASFLCFAFSLGFPVRRFGRLVRRQGPCAQ